MENQIAVALWLRLEDTGRQFTSHRDRITIGRSAECDLTFPESRVLSRRHAVIFYRGENWYLTDCGSVNGTWLNHERLSPGEERPLKSGDVIELARTHKITFLHGLNPSPWGGNTVSLGGWKPPVEEAQRCGCCGAPVSGVFCHRCGTRVGIPPAPPVEPPLPSYGMAPATMPAPSAAPFPMTAPCEAPPPMTAYGMAPEPAPSIAPQPMPAPSAASAPAPKKLGLFAKLFGGKSQSAPAPRTSVPAVPAAPVPVTADDVQFRGTAPEAITPGEYFPVKIMMYREDDYQRADRESAAVADKATSASSSVYQAQLGQEFRICLQSPDLELDCETQYLRWNGKFAAADFEVYLPEDYGRRQLRLRGRVYSGDGVLTDLKLILQVGAAQPQNVVCEKVRLRSAFISYASADRARVVARIQGIQLACPDMDLFFDVESLRRGESWENRLYQEIAGRDLFYLFWSQNAASSEWVKKELQYALSRKTIDYIEPIPLEAPDICPPPDSLTGKHFNDWTLRYLNNL